MPITRLNQEQRQALPALEWMMNPSNRRAGKSIALAIATIRAACRNPGVRVDVIDHTPHYDMRKRMVTLIHDFLRNDPRLRDYSTRNTGDLVIHLPEPILDWWPPGFEPDETWEVPTLKPPPKPVTVKKKRPVSKWKNLGKI